MNRPADIYVWILYILLTPLGTMSNVYNYANTTKEAINCKNMRFQNVTHTKYYYEVPLYSSVPLLSCGETQSKYMSYWFTTEDFCRGMISDVYFATVDINGTGNCLNQSLLVPFELCHRNYIFKKDSMTIQNITTSDPHEFICVYGNSIWNPLNISAVSHSISITNSSRDCEKDVSTSLSESTLAETIDTVAAATLESTLISSTTSSPLTDTSSTDVISTTTSTSPAPSIWKVVIPLVLSGLIVITGFTVVFVYYKRRRQREPSIRLEILM